MGVVIESASEVALPHPWNVRFALVTLFVGILVPLGTATSTAAPTVDGREWRELFETTGLSWSQVASVCPIDGRTACSGAVGGHDLTGWTWATADQVRDLLDDYAPGLATADPPVVSGVEGFAGAMAFLSVMRWTTQGRYDGGWPRTARSRSRGWPA